jgi:hypothetical protein
MLCQLRRHPNTPCESVDRIDVEVHSNGANLLLRYRVSGRIGDIRIPPATTSSRADELWKHTCFEAFLHHKNEGYRELNFSPSTEWAAYAFSDYREGMRPLPHISPPQIATELLDSCFELRVALRLDEIADFTSTARLRLGLSAIIEGRNGRKSSWALAHPPGKPDFHHPDCFAVELPPASGT